MSSFIGYCKFLDFNRKTWKNRSHYFLITSCISYNLTLQEDSVGSNFSILLLNDIQNTKFNDLPQYKIRCMPVESSGYQKCCSTCMWKFVFCSCMWNMQHPKNLTGGKRLSIYRLFEEKFIQKFLERILTDLPPSLQK